MYRHLRLLQIMLGGQQCHIILEFLLSLLDWVLGWCPAFSDQAQWTNDCFTIPKSCLCAPHWRRHEESIMTLSVPCSHKRRQTSALLLLAVAHPTRLNARLPSPPRLRMFIFSFIRRLVRFYCDIGCCSRPSAFQLILESDARKCGCRVSFSNVTHSWILCWLSSGLSLLLSSLFVLSNAFIVVLVISCVIAFIAIVTFGKIFMII